MYWMNGQLVESPAISPLDRGWTLGDGVFDTMLALDGVVQHAGLHAARLARHARTFDIKIPDPAQLPGAIDAVLAANNLTKGRACVRVTLSRGIGHRGLTPPANPEPTIIIQAFPAPDPASLPPIKAITSKIVRRNEGSPLSYIKSLNYGDHIIAIQEAAAHEANEAILLNNKGHACCATIGNIFVRTGKTILTPPLKDGVLDGITRAQLLADGFAREEHITASALAKCDALFITNSLNHIRAVTELDGRTLDSAFIRR